MKAFLEKFLGTSPITTLIGLAIGAYYAVIPLFEAGGKPEWTDVIKVIVGYLAGRFAADSVKAKAPIKVQDLKSTPPVESPISEATDAEKQVKE